MNARITVDTIGLTNGTTGTTNGTVGTNVSNNGNNGTIGSPKRFRVIWLPMVPLVKFPMLPLGESERAHNQSS